MDFARDSPGSIDFAIYAKDQRRCFKALRIFKEFQGDIRIYDKGHFWLLGTKKMFASTVAKRYLKYRQEKLFCYGNSGCLTFCTQNAHRPHLKKSWREKLVKCQKILNGKPGPGIFSTCLFLLSSVVAKICFKNHPFLFLKSNKISHNVWKWPKMSHLNF